MAVLPDIQALVLAAPIPSDVQLLVVASQFPLGVEPPAPPVAPLMSQYRLAALPTVPHVDITAATARANDDRRHYYLLGYSSGEGVDPERALITVRVGRPGVNVRARTRIGRQDAAR